MHFSKLVGWLFGCNGPLGQYFSLYWAVSQREGERGEKGQLRVKMSKQPPSASTASAVSPCPTVIQIVGRPGTGSLPSTIAPSDHPHFSKSRSYSHRLLLRRKQAVSADSCFPYKIVGKDGGAPIYPIGKHPSIRRIRNHMRMADCHLRLSFMKVYHDDANSNSTREQ